MEPQRLWPVRPTPLDDELLSMWLLRIAKANGRKLQAFCDSTFGKHRQLWNRDVDRLAPEWLIKHVAEHTGILEPRIWQTTLSSYEGILFSRKQPSGQLRWILPLLLYHRRRLGFGLQFCPQCLGEDYEPYFRKRWRVAFYTFCVRHNCMLHERCPNCLSPIAFHRRELGRPEVLSAGLACTCCECDFDLRRAAMRPITVFEPESFERLRSVAEKLELAVLARASMNIELTNVLHQLCKLITSTERHIRLFEFTASELGINTAIRNLGRCPFEKRSIDERHLVLQMAMWFLVEPQTRLRHAWKAGAIRYNHLLKDLDAVPHSFRQIVAPLNRLTRYRVAGRGVVEGAGPPNTEH